MLHSVRAVELKVLTARGLVRTMSPSLRTIVRHGVSRVALRSVACLFLGYGLLATVMASAPQNTPAGPRSVQAPVPATGRAKPSCTVSEPGEPATLPGGGSTSSPSAIRATELPSAEHDRQRIFVDIRKAVESARRETVAAYPPSSSAPLVSPSDATKPRRYAEAFRISLLASESRFLAEVSAQNRVTCDQIRAIFREGQVKKWADH